jgi:hypothetical protein
LIDFEAFEVGVQYKLLSGDHLIGSNRDHPTVLLNKMDKYAKPIQFCEVFGSHNILEAFEDNFLVLPCETPTELKVVLRT